jgi:hypothetical protein
MDGRRLYLRPAPGYFRSAVEPIRQTQARERRKSPIFRVTSAASLVESPDGLREELS